MQLAVMLGQILESGKLKVSANEVEAIEITASNKNIDVNATDKEFIKEVIASARKGGKKEGVTETVKGRVQQIKSAKTVLDMAKDAAEELKEAGITVTISYKGAVVLTLGSKAKPTLSRLITGSKAIEINSLPKLVEMGI